jgi:copper chaperone
MSNDCTDAQDDCSLATADATGITDKWVFMFAEYTLPHWGMFDCDETSSFKDVFAMTSASSFTPPTTAHVFTVTGMSCGHCEKAVTQALRQVDAQATVHIDRAAQRVEILSTQSRDVLAQAIREEGYTVAA